MNLETLDNLFELELRELYDEERRLIDALPKLAHDSASERLRKAFEEHLLQTKSHVRRLEECFRDLGRTPESGRATGMKALIEDSHRMADSMEQSPLRDAALIGAARRVEHYEMASYAEVLSFAESLGHEKIARHLRDTLREEQETDAKLSEISKATVNQEALQLGAHQRR